MNVVKAESAFESVKKWINIKIFNVSETSWTLVGQLNGDVPNSVRGVLTCKS
tara:strand:- start:312 stop:467 length:156 start_codon:yes stop_codon:yes gene_type:complete